MGRWRLNDKNAIFHVAENFILSRFACEAKADMLKGMVSMVWLCPGCGFWAEASVCSHFGCSGRVGVTWQSQASNKKHNADCKTNQTRDQKRVQHTKERKAEGPNSAHENKQHKTKKRKTLNLD